MTASLYWLLSSSPCTLVLVSSLSSTHVTEVLPCSAPRTPPAVLAFGFSVTSVCSFLAIVLPTPLPATAPAASDRPAIWYTPSFKSVIFIFARSISSEPA